MYTSSYSEAAEKENGKDRRTTQSKKETINVEKVSQSHENEAMITLNTDINAKGKKGQLSDSVLG